jgi:hypothetical protein
MTRVALAVLLLAVPGLAACGGTKEFRVSQVPREPLRSFGKVEVAPFTIDGLEGLDEKKQAKAREAAAFITGELHERLSGSSWFPGAGRVLRLQGRLVGFDPGSQALRYFSGAAAGEGEIVADVVFTDESGASVAKGFAVGTVHGGMYGGTTRSAARRLAKAIVNFIDDNYAEVTSVATAP